MTEVDLAEFATGSGGVDSCEAYSAFVDVKADNSSAIVVSRTTKPRYTGTRIACPPPSPHNAPRREQPIPKMPVPHPTSAISFPSMSPKLLLILNNVSAASWAPVLYCSRATFGESNDDSS